MNASASESGPDVLGVLLTSKCNISCRHCCNDSHPRHAGAVAFDEIAGLIASARDIPSIKEIGFSGGEPFLFVPLLRQAIQHAASLGFTSSVTTNGFWARSAHAGDLLRDLAGVGLRGIHISTSVFHQEFIGLSTVIAAASCALGAGVNVTINLVSSSALGPDALRLALGDLVDKVRIVVMPCLPAGRGHESVHEEEFVRALATPIGNCREHFKKMAIDRAGNVYPCCSPGGFTPPLRMGNVHESSLRSIVDAAASNALFAVLESVGPQFFLPFLRAAQADPALPDRFSDQCHLCHVMLSSPRCVDTIRAASEQLVEELSALAAAEAPLDGERLNALVARTRAGGHGQKGRRHAE